MPDHAEPTRTARTAPRRTVSADWLDQTTGVDLRRPRDRQAADRLVLRADWLAPADRDLVLAVLRDGQTIAALARLHHADPRLLRRRFAALVARLLDERTAFVARTLPTLRGTRARVAKAFYLHGRTLRAIADEHNLTLHVVRAHRQAIEGLYEAARNNPRAWRDAQPNAQPTPREGAQST